MTAITTDRASTVTSQTALTDRFILTGVERLTLVFPAVWVAEILRIERSQILDLPFYNPLLVGIVNHGGVVTPLITAARLLDLASSTLPERLLVVRLDRTAGNLANIGIIVDRAIGSSTRTELPPSLFEPGSDDPQMRLISAAAISPDLWQPQRWSVN
jgi:chemotaxis signal transduction protein